jgi:hypothetical protein
MRRVSRTWKFFSIVELDLGDDLLEEEWSSRLFMVGYLYPSPPRIVRSHINTTTRYYQAY